MALKENDLKNTVIKRISVDEFEPKTGEARDVAVIGFRVTEETAGQDIYTFLSRGSYNDSIRDIEVSPNSNDEGYYFVFAEVDRNENTVDLIKEVVKDITLLSGDLDWHVSTHLTEEDLPLDIGLEQYFISDPDQYMSKEDWEAKKSNLKAFDLDEGFSLSQEVADQIVDSLGGEEGYTSDDIYRAVEEYQSMMDNPEKLDVEEVVQIVMDKMDVEEALDQQNDNILEFLNKSLLDDVVIEGDIITMTKGKDTAKLRIADFGDKKVMSDIGIAESAIKPLDSVLRKFNSMLGEMRAVPIDDYIVVFHPEQQQVLVTQQCLDS